MPLREPSTIQKRDLVNGISSTIICLVSRKVEFSKFKYHFLQMYFLAFLTNLLLHINYYKVIITRDLIM
jgi:hypothetical protein